MASLAERQRTLLAVLKGRVDSTSAEGADARNLAASLHMRLLQEIMLWWRAFGITRYCRMTVAILRWRRDFDQVIAAFVRDSPGSSFIEEQGDLFLSYVARDPDPLVAAVAATERALIRSHRHIGAPQERIAWRHDPEAVFAFVLSGIPFQRHEIMGSFEVRVDCGDEPGIEWYATAREET